MTRAYFFGYLIDIIIVRVEILEVFFLARNEAVMSGKVVEEALVVGALTILETLDLDLTRLLFFGVVDLLANVGEATEVQVI